jgi:hypothetical protein
VLEKEFEDEGGDGGGRGGGGGGGKAGKSNKGSLLDNDDAFFN